MLCKEEEDGTPKSSKYWDLSNSNYFQNSISPISISISDVKGKIVSPGEKIMIKLVVYYPPSSNFGGKKEFNYSIGLLVKSH